MSAMTRTYERGIDTLRGGEACGIIRGASKTTYQKNGLDLVAEVKPRSTETKEVSMLHISTSQRITDFGILDNPPIVISHNRVEVAS